MSTINLSKQYIHTGHILGPGNIDVKEELKKRGLSEVEATQAHKDLADRAKEFDEREKKGLNPELAPITYETTPVGIDGALSQVQPAIKGTDPDTTQKAPAK